MLHPVVNVNCSHLHKYQLSMRLNCVLYESTNMHAATLCLRDMESSAQCLLRSESVFVTREMSVGLKYRKSCQGQRSKVKVNLTKV